MPLFERPRYRLIPGIRHVNRVEAAAELIRAAMRAYEDPKHWPIALSLARAAGQFCSERLKVLGKQESQKLRQWHQQVNASLGLETTFKKYASLSNEPANLLKHTSSADEPLVLDVNALQVAAIIYVAIFDYVEIAGNAPLDMWEFRDFVEKEAQVFAEKIGDEALRDSVLAKFTG